MNRLTANLNERSIIMSFKKLMLFIYLGLLPTTILFAQNFEYVGVARCKMCHNSPARGQQYKIWKASKHAQAMKVLTPVEAKNPKCLKCHSTAGSVDPSLWAGIKVSEGVSCESCHGPGSKYKSYSVMRNHKKSLADGLIIPNEQTCKKCHNPKSPHYKGFNYKKALAKIAHPIPPKE